jgi:hypothetical protein
MDAFVDKITHFHWLDLDGLHGLLHVWQEDGARLVLFTEDQTGNTYVLQDESLGGGETGRPVR